MFKLTVNFFFFCLNYKIEQSNNCNYDNLQIFDGDIENPVKNYTFCGSPQHLTNIYSSSNKLYLKFNSDFIVTSNGFMVQYRQSE